ncbi:MAG TPA: [protein-PII] uridylyltransferase [Nitrospirota bacterium]|nr:[protein-PII] uridylyltransferase [Nitrospirota bacterium]
MINKQQDNYLINTPAGIRTMLQEENEVIRVAHFGGAGGSEIVQRRTGLIDRTLREAHARLSAAGTMPSLVAIGGYGRGELNPHSDIDIMLLCKDESDRKRSPQLLYLLWDAGLDVGYSVRTVKECAALARQDIKIRTSLLESRFVAGDPGLYDAFSETMRSEVFYWKAAEFIHEKIAERNATRRKLGGSVYLREPNIKEGEGGLRDFHTALWVSFVHFRISSLAELVARNVITEGQYAVFQRSRNFLWRVRNEVHYLSGRKNDHLTFDLQERAASDFHYRDSVHLFAVERFMKAYFLHARNVREFTSIVTEAVLPKPSRRWFERKLLIGPFSLIGKTLVPPADDICRDDMSLVLSAFEIAQTRHAVLSDHLKSLIRGCKIDDQARVSPSAAKTFLAILNNPDGLSETLSLMKELRFLGRYLPEFRAIQALARHDYYHLYTVDEHILLAIRSLQKLWTGNYPGLVTLSDAMRTLKKRWILFLAVLLHDLGKAFRHDHERAGAMLTETILTRLGIEGEDRQRVLFLVKNHLVMSTLSQRRELTDRKVMTDFIRLVQDRENLSLLYLLTYADISAVNPTAWTQWKAVLLQDLYLRTLDCIEKSTLAGEEDKERLAAQIARIRTAAADKFTLREVDDFISVMSDQYFLYTSTRKVIYHMEMMRRLRDEQLVIDHRHYPERGYTELVVCAYDAYGMFYRTAGAIASKNLNILRAQVYTSKSGVMLDTFQITDADGKLCDYEPAWESVLGELRMTLKNKSRPAEPSLYGRRLQPAAAITPVVDFDNDTSESFTIIDISARDRVGLLYSVTKALYELSLDIGSAKIVTEGSRVMDSFYVTDYLHGKITEERRLEKIKETLMAVLGEGEPRSHPE